jgi:hypothetical protein
LLLPVFPGFEIAPDLCSEKSPQDQRPEFGADIMISGVRPDARFASGGGIDPAPGCEVN